MTRGLQPSMGNLTKAISSTAIMRLRSLTSDYIALVNTDEKVLAPLVAEAEQELAHKAGGEVARKAMKLVMSAYRTPDLADPASFVDQAVAALEDYPAVIVARLASPKTGIVRESKFAPTIAELVAWCEAELRPLQQSVDMACRQITRQQDAAKHLLQLAASREEKASRQAEWDAGEPERRRKAEEAQREIERAAFKRAAEEANRKRRADAVTAWNKAFYSAIADKGEDVLTKAFSLTEADQDEATEAELKAPGTGAALMLAKIGL